MAPEKNSHHLHQHLVSNSTPPWSAIRVSRNFGNAAICCEWDTLGQIVWIKWILWAGEWKVNAGNSSKKLHFNNLYLLLKLALWKVATGKLAASVKTVSGGDPIGPFMARNARWIAPIMIAVEILFFGRICCECSVILFFPRLPNPSRSLTNQWSKFTCYEIILFSKSSTEDNLVPTQLDHSKCLQLVLSTIQHFLY